MHLICKGAIAALISTVVAYGQPTIAGCPILPADNIWNTPVDKLPVHANSAAYISTMGAGLPLRPDFGSGTYAGGPFGMPYITVPDSQPKLPVSFYYDTESDKGPYPVPLNAAIEGGSASTGDRHVIAIETGSCTLYEMFAAYPQTASWIAGSGAIYNLRSNALRPDTWTSADAAGLPILPGLLRYEDIVAGEVRHAIRVVATQTQMKYIWPARHYASPITDPQYPPMGLRLRLRASFDESGYPPVLQIILRGMKKYGMMVADNGYSWFFQGVPDERWDNDMLRLLLNVKGSDFEAVDVSSLIVDPDSGQARQAAATQVVVTPTSAKVMTQGSQQFTANQASAWMVNGIAGGNSQVGYISASGMYSAPSAVPSPATVQVQAQSGSASAAAAVTIAYPAPVLSSFAPTAVPTGSFTLSINGTGFQTGAVVKLNGNPLATTFNSSSALTATGTASSASAGIPLTVTNPDGQVSNTASLAVTAPTAPPVVSGPVKVTVSPATSAVQATRTLQFTATVQNTADQRVTWRVVGTVGSSSSPGTISSTGLYTAPFNSLARPVTITAISVADPTKFAQAQVQILRK